MDPFRAQRCALGPFLSPTPYDADTITHQKATPLTIRLRHRAPASVYLRHPYIVTVTPGGIGKHVNQIQYDEFHSCGSYYLSRNGFRMTILIWLFMLCPRQTDVCFEATVMNRTSLHPHSFRQINA